MSVVWEIGKIRRIETEIGDFVFGLGISVRTICWSKLKKTFKNS